MLKILILVQCLPLSNTEKNYSIEINGERVGIVVVVNGVCLVYW